MKEYFPHDFKARSDKKIISLMMKSGLEGVGAYWCIIEMLYEEGGYLLRSEYDRISFELRCSNDLVKQVVEGFDLFNFEGDNFTSKSVQKRLKEREEKSQKARNSVEKRWKTNEGDTTVLQTNNECNTIKEKKRKEKEINKRKFGDSVFLSKDEYDKLVLAHGVIKTQKFINVLDNYKCSSGKKYKDDYRAILSWVVDKVLKDWREEPRLRRIVV
jgi:hypothetical protein